MPRKFVYNTAKEVMFSLGFVCLRVKITTSHFVEIFTVYFKIPRAEFLQISIQVSFKLVSLLEKKANFNSIYIQYINISF